MTALLRVCPKALYNILIWNIDSPSVGVLADGAGQVFGAIIVQLVVASHSAYSCSVKFYRALAVIFFGFGLFVQVAAHAAAIPQLETAEMVDCAEMTQAMSGHTGTEEESSNRSGSCHDMTLECLVAMNCLPPLALTDIGAAQAPPLAAGTVYLPAITDRLEGRPMRPESPPPQANFTV